MKKYFAALIAALMMLTGCAGDPAQITSTVFNEPWSGGEPSESSSDPESSADNSYESGAASSDTPKIDLDGAAENVWLFGKKISLPCRFEEFGEDFSLGEEYFYQMNSDLIAFLCYKGEVIGEVILDNCPEDDPNKYAKYVTQIALGDAENNPVKTEGWYNEEIYFDVMGVTMKSSLDKVTELLGEPTKQQGTKRNAMLSYKITDKKFIEITFKNGKIVEFVIESK